MAELPKMTSYYSPQLLVSIRVPEEWTGKLVSDTKLQLYGPEQAAYDDYRPTMSYVRGVPEGQGEAWFEQLIVQSGANMQSSYNGFKLLDEQRFMLSSQAKAYVRHYEWHDLRTGLSFSQLQSLIRVDDSLMYLINAATLKPLAAEYLPIFDAVLRSTRIVRRPG